MKKNKRFIDTKIDVKFKISALWVAIMALYIYNDYFSLFKPGVLEDMLAGNMGLFPATQLALFSAALLMAIPAVMIYLSLILRARVNRILNIILSILYFIVMAFSIQGEWIYYMFMGIVEILLTTTILWYAIKWPRSDE